MSKKTKYFSFAIAIIAVAAVMTIAIYAATSASSAISANVSWTASEGITFELEAWVVNNSTHNGIGATNVPKAITKQIVNANTSNQTAQNLVGDLACGFYDGTDDGVNNPSDVIFTYKIKNTGSNVLKVTATKTPRNAAESGTTAADHKPAVALSSKLDSTDNTSSAISSITGSGYNIAAGSTLEYIVTLSMSNADLSITSFDAGVTFSFGKVEPGTPTVYVNGVQQSGYSVVGATTVGDYIAALDGKTYPGYFYNADLTEYANEDDIVTNDTKLYTKPVTLDKLTFVSNGDGTCSVSGNNPTGEVIIPLVSPAGDSVTSIGIEAFSWCDGLTSITIPDSVTSIGSQAFYICRSLTSITIGNSVTSIGFAAFGTCSSLTSITIPNSVTSIGNQVINSCTSLTSVIVASGNTKYDSRNDCNAIIETSSKTLIAGCNNTVIPNTVTSIGNYAFSGCSGLTSITIPDSVTSIGSAAFDACSGLTSITIGNSVTSIGSLAFRNCESLTSIYIPSSVTTISASSYSSSPFYSCSSTLKIYCGASSKPSGWGTYWNYYASGKTLSTTWGITRATYNSTYA